jgi:hypothetical protein
VAVPDNLADVYNGISLPVSATASHLECGSLAAITCNEQ